MNQQNSEQKTEKPTPKRLRDAKKKGNVPRSKELVSAVIMFLFVLLMVISSDFMQEALHELVLFPTSTMNENFPNALKSVMNNGIENAALIILPILAIIIIATVIGSLLSGGWVFAIDKIKPNLQNLSPIEAVKKIFSIKNAVEFIKSILKAIVFVAIFYFTMRYQLDELVKIPTCGLECVYEMWGQLTIDLLIYFVIVFIIFAILDLIFQHKQHIKSLMMSMEEIKKESKEQEGNPEIKGQRRALYQEIVFEDMFEEVDDSSVVIANPTHVLVGLYYKEGKTPLPMVTFKHKGEVALRLKEYAKEKDIPIVENVALARGLLKKAKKNQTIPSEFIRPVAEVIKFVRKIEKQKKSEQNKDKE